MMCFIFFAAKYGASKDILAVCSPLIVLALLLALQLGMPRWICYIEVFVAAGLGLYLFFAILCQSSRREDSFILGSASLALLVTALNALVPAAAVYTLLPLVWAVGSGFAISGGLAGEKEGVGSAGVRSFFSQFLTIVGSVVTLSLAVLPWVQAMPSCRGWRRCLAGCSTLSGLLSGLHCRGRNQRIERRYEKRERG